MLLPSHQPYKELRCVISFESYNNPNKWSHFAAGETEAERLRQHYDVMGARPAEL